MPRAKMILMLFLFDKSALRAYSAIFSNLSAGWFGVAFITPNFIQASSIELLITLTKDLAFGILCLLATIVIEREITR